jgi:hypothetical protein
MCRIFSTSTIVIIENFYINAHTTTIAMTKIVPSSYSAESTFFTVPRIFSGIHP